MKNHRLAQLSRHCGYYFEMGFDHFLLGNPRAWLRDAIEDQGHTLLHIEAYELGWDHAARADALLSVGTGHWLPPKRWVSLLCRTFRLTAPDRWIPHFPKSGAATPARLDSSTVLTNGVPGEANP